MEVLKLLDSLEELVGGGGRIPLTGKVVLNEDEVIEVIQQIRNALPEELQQAKWVVKERQRILAEAEKEAKDTVDQGKEYITKMVDENQIAQQAREQAEGILAEAKAQAQEIYLGSQEYGDRVLGKAEELLTTLLENLHRGREELKRDRK